MSHTLQIYAHSAHHLEDVERFGKNDPYAQFSLDFTEKKSFQKTAVKKNAGKDVDWNQNLNIDNFDPSKHHNLYVEILDEETTADEPIGFTAIPLRQVLDAPGQSFKGKFDLFTTDSKQKGTVTLTISALKPGQSAHGVNPTPELKGYSQIETDHQRRVKSLARKEKVADAGLAAAVIGGLIGAKALHDAHKKAEKTEP
ncbi:hypothetical protein BGX27_003166 [Mortierella sp. AM989]|nr:hypothetical protein BGX27_003166 [Mortierella sp. AM989]